MFKNLILTSLKTKKYLMHFFVVSILLTFCAVYFKNASFSLVLIIAGIIFVSTIGNSIFFTFSDGNFPYRARELFLLPLTKYELTIFLAIEIATGSLFFLLMLINIVNILSIDFYGELTSGKSIFIIILPIMIMGCIVSPFRFRFQKIQTYVKVISMIRILFWVLVSLCFWATIEFTQTKDFNLHRTEYLVIMVIYLLIIIFFGINFYIDTKKKFFNEHVSYKRLIFSPFMDGTAIVIIVTLFARYQYLHWH